MVWSFQGFHCVLFKTVVLERNSNCLSQLTRLLNTPLTLYFLCPQDSKLTEYINFIFFYNFSFFVQSALS